MLDGSSNYGTKCTNERGWNDIQIVVQGHLEWKTRNGSSKVLSCIFFTSEDPIKLPMNENNDPIANENAAWASQTGRGLLFYGLDQNQNPRGSSEPDMDHVTKHESTGFKVRLTGERHVFRAPGTTERDLWVATLRATAE